MQFSDNRSNDENNFQPDEYQQIRVRQLENKFKFKFEPWLYGFAMTLREPVKAYAWFVQSKKYWMIWKPETKVLNFCDDEKNSKWAKWAIQNIKRFLDKELFEHFGKIEFQANGQVYPEKRGMEQ